MKNFRRVKDHIYYDCEANACPTPNTPHSVTRNQLMAALYTLLDDLAQTRDVRVEALEVGTGLLWDYLYPEQRKNPKVDQAKLKENPPFEASYTQLRQEIDAIRLCAVLPMSTDQSKLN